MSTAPQCRAAYRHLLRAVPHAVGYNRAATKNIRRVLADDVRAELARPNNAFMERAQSTLLLYLAAARARSEETRTPQTTRIHRIMSNLSSLSYHHLSPHTAMQPNERTRRIGGTDARASRRHRSRRADAKFIDGRADEKAPSGTATPNSINADGALLSLQVLGKRPRGPIVGTVDARIHAGQRWNGQNAERFVATLEEANLAAEVDRLAASREERQGPATQFKEARGRLRAFRRARSAEEEAKQLRKQAEGMLADVVARASRVGPFLGEARFLKLARGEWLPP